jgi:hypothetical protein
MESEDVETMRLLSVPKFILPPGFADCGEADTIDSSLKTLLIVPSIAPTKPSSLTWIKTKTTVLISIHGSKMHQDLDCILLENIPLLSLTLDLLQSDPDCHHFKQRRKNQNYWTRRNQLLTQFTGVHFLRLQKIVHH